MQNIKSIGMMKTPKAVAEERLAKDVIAFFSQSESVDAKKFESVIMDMISARNDQENKTRSAMKL